MTGPPLVSIVMPSFNQARFIPEAINSVLEQDYANIELIVSDGGSTDGAVEILEGFSRRDARVRWVSEADDGPAAAINKALEKARGALIGWLNSDDRYLAGAIGRAVSAFAGDDQAAMIYGQGEHIDDNGVSTGPYPTQKPGAGLKGFETGCYICQPTVFFKWTTYKLVGPLDVSFKAAFDYEYWMRIFSKLPDRIGFIDAVQAQSRLYDDCITVRSRKQVALEGMRVCAAYLGYAQSHWLSSYLEEVAVQSASERGFDDFSAHAREVFEEASPYLLKSDLERLREQVDSFPSS